MLAVSLLVAAVIAGADLGIKYYIEKHVGRNEERSIWKQHGILRKVHNHGMMLNRLEKYPFIVRAASVAALGILLFWQIFVLKKAGHAAEKIGAALMTGGAVSNTYDRISRGYVVDYLAFKTSKEKLTNVTFNLGDFAIFGGAILLVIGALHSGKK